MDGWKVARMFPHTHTHTCTVHAASMEQQSGYKMAWHNVYSREAPSNFPNKAESADSNRGRKRPSKRQSKAASLHPFSPVKTLFAQRLCTMYIIAVVVLVLVLVVVVVVVVVCAKAKPQPTNNRLTDRLANWQTGKPAGLSTRKVSEEGRRCWWAIVLQLLQPYSPTALQPYTHSHTHFQAFFKQQQATFAVERLRDTWLLSYDQSSSLSLSLSQCTKLLQLQPPTEWERQRESFGRSLAIKCHGAFLRRKWPAAAAAWRMPESVCVSVCRAVGL